MLDNPVWHALVTQHSPLALTAAGAARYPSAIAPFAAVADTNARAADQLASLVADAETVHLVGVAPPPPPGWRIDAQKPVLQMVCETRAPDIAGPPVIELGAGHADGTLEMGRYIGICDGSRLAAMAGERLRLDGYQEISAVCTNPDYTGRGYAKRLLARLCNSAFDRGFKPFLHVYADNERAIAVYRRLAFADRAVLPFWALHQ